MQLDEFVFRLQHTKNAAWELGGDCFVFYKVKALVDQYARFFARLPDFAPQRIFELGIWDGGSIAFWFEVFQPRKHVAIDFLERGDTAYFERYLHSRQAQDRVATHWRVDQGDRLALRRLAATEFDGPLDLVLDDASHLYAPSKASFEALFPRLQPGGFYIIEDWAWAHWPAFHSPQEGWIHQVPLTKLVHELTEAAGTSRQLIASLTVFEGFVAIERGEEVLSPEEADDFSLDARTCRMPPPSFGQRWRQRAGGLRRRLRTVFPSGANSSPARPPASTP